jgi:hypothetical protein
MKRKRRKKADCRVWFQDEAPTIGNGLRGVTVVKIGRKWVRIQETSTGRAARLPLRVWEELSNR